MALARLAILIGPKGRGSNLRALAEACASGELDAKVTLVVSPVPDSPAAQWTRTSGLPLAVLPSDDGDYAARLLRLLKGAGATWVCLAGYTRLLPSEALGAYPNRVLNIHPALLPKFGGKGMYGGRVHRAVLESGDRESGCTVHFVNERYDEGEILLQQRCPVEPGDTPEALAARVLKLELRAYKEALRRAIAEHGP